MSSSQSGGKYGSIALSGAALFVLVSVFVEVEAVKSNPEKLSVALDGLALSETNDCTVSGMLIEEFLEPIGVDRKSTWAPAPPPAVNGEVNGGLRGGESASDVVIAVSSWNPKRELEFELELYLLLPMKSERVGVCSNFLLETREEVGTGLTHSAAGVKKGEMCGGLFVVIRTGCLGMNSPLPLSFSLTEDALDGSNPEGTALTVDALLDSELEGHS